MSATVQDLLDRHRILKEARRPWEDHWQALAEVMLPRRADFVAPPRPGAPRTERIFDGTPMLARRGLSAAIDGLLKPKTSRWFRIKPRDEALARVEEVKVWLEAVEEALFAAIYDPRARFIQRSGEVDDDLVTFGTGCLFTGEGRARDRLMFRSLHVKDVFPSENADGVIDTLFVAMALTARQAAERYGLGRLGAKVAETLKGPRAEPDRTFPFLWAVEPRHGRDARREDGANLAFASTVIDVESQHLVAAGGFHEFPFAVPRWDTASGELFGRSPAMLALADANTLQAQAKTLLVAGQKAVDPPLLVADDGVIGTARTYPGGISHFDVEIARELGGRPPVIPLETGANVPLGREMLEDARDQIWAAFFRNVLQLPTAAPRMTATEVLERKDEFIRTIGPVFGRLESDYIAPVVERSFALLLRAGALPAPPAALRGRELAFAYASPVEQARRQIEAAAAARSLEILAPFVQADPAIMDNFDGDAITRDVPDIFGTPRRWLRTEAEVGELRRRRDALGGIAAALTGAPAGAPGEGSAP